MSNPIPNLPVAQRPRQIMPEPKYAETSPVPIAAVATKCTALECRIGKPIPVEEFATMFAGCDVVVQEKEWVRNAPCPVCVSGNLKVKASPRGSDYKIRYRYCDQCGHSAKIAVPQQLSHEQVERMDGFGTAIIILRASAKQ